MDLIDFREIAKAHSFAEHAEKADMYFRPFPFDCRLMHKPFMSYAEAAEICAGLGVLIPQLHLFAGARVLDFGAGTCWLSRILALLGCEVTAVDVSAHALDLGRRLIETDPLAANMRVSFVKLETDHLPFDDASFDRVVCFDALHHVPDQERIVGEFARVARPGGIVACHEPGPRHSTAVQSQLEMRMHGVIEGDIDVPALERAGRAAGFSDCRVALFGPAPQLLPPAAYDAFVEGTSGPGVEQEAVRQVRDAMRSKRVFFFSKGDWRAHLDSRSYEGLHGTLTLQAEWAENGVRVRGHAMNTGSTAWLQSSADPGGVRLGVHLHDRGGRLVDRDYQQIWITESPIYSGRSVDVDALIALPAGHESLTLTFDLVAAEVCWFEIMGCVPVSIEVDCARRQASTQPPAAAEPASEAVTKPVAIQEPRSSLVPLSEEAVTWAYRMLLGREPESAEVVAAHVRNHGDVQALRQSFMRSSEFLARLPAEARCAPELASRIDCGVPGKSVE